MELSIAKLFKATLEQAIKDDYGFIPNDWMVLVVPKYKKGFGVCLVSSIPLGHETKKAEEYIRSFNNVSINVLFDDHKRHICFF